MLEMEKFSLKGKQLRLVARKDSNGRPVYDVVFPKQGIMGLSIDDVRVMCQEIKEDVDALAFSGLTSNIYAHEIDLFEEAYKNENRADADGADGA